MDEQVNEEMVSRTQSAEIVAMGSTDDTVVVGLRCKAGVQNTPLFAFFHFTTADPMPVFLRMEGEDVWSGGSYLVTLFL